MQDQRPYRRPQGAYTAFVQGCNLGIALKLNTKLLKRFNKSLSS